MGSTQENGLVGLAIKWIRENSPEPDAVSAAITADTDLLESGLLDSLGFVGLVAFLEETTGAQVDLMDLDTSEFTTLRGLCGHAASPRE